MRGICHKYYQYKGDERLTGDIIRQIRNSTITGRVEKAIDFQISKGDVESSSDKLIFDLTSVTFPKSHFGTPINSFSSAAKML